MRWIAGHYEAGYMAFFFLLLGAAFALILTLSNIYRTLRRRPTITLGEVRLFFFTAILIMVALIIKNQGDNRYTVVEWGVLVIASSLIVIGLLLAGVELFTRRQRLRQSRGIFTFGVGVLMGFSALTMPLIAGSIVREAVFSITTPVPVNVTPGPTLDPEQRIAQITEPLFQLIAEETGLDAETVLAEVEGGRTIAELVIENGGDIERLISRGIAILTEQINQLEREGLISSAQAVSLLNILPFGVRYIVMNDIDSIQNLFGGQIPTPNATQVVMTQTAAVITPTIITRTPTVTPSITRTPTSTPTVTPSRTPRPTDSPTPTRERFQSPTPTLTPTLPNPCLAVMNFNVNLRTQPDLEDSEVVTTIPFQTVVAVYGRTEDRLWWFGEYEGQAGWLSAEFIALTPACEVLPVRRP